MSLDLDRSAWRRVKFGDVVRNLNENVRDLSEAGIERVIGLDHLDPGELRITRWGDASEETTFTRRVKPGQVLFGKRRAYQRKTAYADFAAVCSGDILVFESADPNTLEPQLLPFLAMTDSFYERALQTSAGSLSPRTKWADLAKFEFDLPPLDQQRRIADLLWAIEAHDSALNDLGARVTEAVRALLADIPAGARTVGDVVTRSRAGATPLRSREDYYGGAIPWLKSGEVSGSSITETEETISELGLAESSVWVVPEGATCVALYGATRGAVGRLGKAMATNQAVLSLVPDPNKCHDLFLFLWMNALRDHLQGLAAGGAQKNLTKALVLSEPFPDLQVPEQEEVIEKWELMESARAQCKAESKHLEQLRTAVLEILGGAR